MVTTDSDEHNDELFIQEITSLPKKKRSRGESLQDIVTKNYVILREALERGYSYEELTPYFLKHFQRKIKGETLRKYMSRAKSELAEQGEGKEASKADESNSSPSDRGQPKPSKKELKDRVFSKPDDKIKDKFQDM